MPALRNADRRPTPEFVKPYTRNGYFKGLKSLVHFYNTRGVLPRCPAALRERDALPAGCWPAPEVSENVNRKELGDLQLSSHEEDAIIASLSTLSDGFKG